MIFKIWFKSAFNKNPYWQCFISVNVCDILHPTIQVCILISDLVKWKWCHIGRIIHQERKIMCQSCIMKHFPIHLEYLNKISPFNNVKNIPKQTF